jgi:hypothetical protein
MMISVQWRHRLYLAPGDQLPDWRGPLERRWKAAEMGGEAQPWSQECCTVGRVGDDVIMVG